MDKFITYKPNLGIQIKYISVCGPAWVQNL